MDDPVRIILVEDSDADAALLGHALDKAGLVTAITRVEDGPGLERALAEGPWDAVVTDHHLPRFSAAGALEVVRRSGADIPLIVISGVLSVEQAVELMRAGARDFVPKDELVRLGPAIMRERQSARDRHHQAEADESLRRRTAALTERVKEMACLYAVSRLVEDRQRPLEDMFADLLDAIPDGWQFPGLLEVAITYDGHTSASRGYRKTEWSMCADIVQDGLVLGSLCVAYREAPPRREGAPPFLAEEHDLIEEVVRRIGEALGARNHDRWLRESEERFRRLMEQASDVMLVIDAEGKLVDANHRACKALGYSRGELTRMRFGDVCRTPGTTETTAESPIGHRPLRREMVQICRDGTTYPAEVSFGPFEAGGRVLVLAISRDLSERRRAEAVRLDLERRIAQGAKLEALGTLAGGIAHDFNNMLVPIIGLTELTRDELEPGSEGHARLGKVVAAAQRAGELVGRIKNFARDDTPLPRPLDLAETLSDCLGLLNATVPSTITIRERFEDLDGPVMADPAQVQAVVMNLASNAVDALEGGIGEIEVSLEQVDFRAEGADGLLLTPGLYARLRVADTGPGISEEVLARVFDPFFTTKEVGRGTGLGLATVHSIVAKHGGAVSIDSAPGTGTRVDVYLPLSEAEASAVPATPPQAS